MRKKLSMLLLCSILLIGVWLPSTASADIHSGTRSWYGVNYHSSVTNTNFTVGGVTYSYRTLFDDARFEWHNKAPVVYLTKTAHIWADTYYVGTTSDPSLVGKIFPYNGSLDLVGIDNYFLYANAYVYHNNFEKFNYTKANRLATATHEVGHTVKMGHPKTYEGSSVMHQGSGKATFPTTWDLGELKKKWN